MGKDASCESRSQGTPPSPWKESVSVWMRFDGRMLESVRSVAGHASPENTEMRRSESLGNDERSTIRGLDCYEVSG